MYVFALTGIEELRVGKDMAAMHVMVLKEDLKEKIRAVLKTAAGKPKHGVGAPGCRGPISKKRCALIKTTAGKLKYRFSPLTASVLRLPLVLWDF